MLELPSPHVIALNIAVVFYVCGFLFRNQIVLRSLVLSGSACYIFYYFTVAESPLWEAIWSTSLIAAATGYGLVLLLLSRSRITVPRAHLPILDALQSFGHLEPGLFRALMAAGTVERAAAETPLTAAGVPPEALVFLISGEMRIRKGEVDLRLPGPCFVGEIGWILGTPASADVFAVEGARLVRWPRDRLRRAMRRNSRLETALDALIARDMARKVAAAAPKRAAPAGMPDRADPAATRTARTIA